MFCTHCGVQNPDNANFCSSCGKEITAQPAEPVEPQPQVHHPWMTSEPSHREQPKSQPRERQEQGKDEASNQERRKQGWSKTKKIFVGIAIGITSLFLFLMLLAAIIGEPVEVDEGNDSEPVAESPKQGLGVSLNDIEAELEDTWKFGINRATSVQDGTEVSEGTFKDDRFPATLRIEEAKGEITKFEARINAAQGSEKLSAEDNAVLSVGMLSAFMELVLPEWGEEGAEWLVRSGADLADGDSPVRTTYKNAEITYALKSGILTLTIQSDEDGSETAKVLSPVLTATRRPPPTVIPPAMPEPPEPPSEEDRIAGAHCLSVLESSSESMLHTGMSQPISRKWYGYDPSSLKMGDHKIYPLGSEIHSAFVERQRYGDPWRNHEEHAAKVEFSVETDEGRRVKRTAAFWVKNDDCTIALIDFD